MLSDEFIKIKKEELQALGDQLHKELSFAKQFIDSGKKPKNERQWFSSIRDVCIYGTFLIQNLISTLENYKKLSEAQIGFYIGKIAIQSFLDIINAFELSVNNLISSNSEISELLDKRIQKKIDLIGAGWKEEVNSKSRKLKKNIEEIFRRKNREMKFIRDTLKKEKIIDELDYKILEFSWDVRNSMHNNFLAIKDIEFSAPGTSLSYSFNFRKGEELYHPVDLKSFYSMTEQIIFIHLKILQHFNKHVEQKTKAKNTSW
jgi:hypothetical protein